MWILAVELMRLFSHYMKEDIVLGLEVILNWRVKSGCRNAAGDVESRHSTCLGMHCRVVFVETN